MNASSYLGYNDWRLSTITDQGGDGCNFSFSGTDCGYNPDLATGELADLYFRALGNDAAYNSSGDFTGGSLTQTGPFDNIQSYSYWSSTEFPPPFTSLNVDYAWVFDMGNGNQGFEGKDGIDLFDPGQFAWAVRDAGASSSSSIPVPPTLALLIMLPLFQRWRNRRA